MNSRPKLELTWIGKENRPRLEPRILLEMPEHSYHADHRVSENDIFDNVLIHGDNLLALKALEQDYAGKVKCVCIDPPYNTGSAFTHYDDGVEHSLWLSLMRDRLEIMRTLMSDDAILLVFTDDTELHYMKVLLDEVFGRQNYCGQIIWEKKRKPSFLHSNIASVVDFITCYAKNRRAAPQFISGYSSEDESYPFYNAGNARTDLVFPAGSVWFKGFDDQTIESQDMSKSTSKVTLKTDVIIKNEYNENAFTLNGEWRYSQDSLDNFVASGEKMIIKRMPFRPRRPISELKPKKMHNLLSRSHYDIGTNEDAATESINLFGKEHAFDYPKPEKTIRLLLQAVTQPGDLVLDSFAGSGTTGAVAHKMGRRWIMVELGDHAFTHIAPRLRKVVNGGDLGGVTELTGWKGGGGFRTYRLAPSLMKEDKWGRLVVNPDYNAEMLAEALCKHEGFTYEPSDEHFWMQGHSTESDFIYVTTQTLTADQLRFIADEVGPDRTLLVVCSAWRGDETDFPNLTLKKIPNAVLNRCEWGRDDYSLNVASLPEAPPQAADTPYTNDLPLFTESVEEDA